MCLPGVLNSKPALLTNWVRLTLGYHPWSCSPLPPRTQRTSAVSNHKTLGKPKVTPHQEKIGVPLLPGNCYLSWRWTMELSEKSLPN